MLALQELAAYTVCMLCFRWLVAFALLAVGLSCGDDDPASSPDAGDSVPDASGSVPDAGSSMPDAGGAKPDASTPKDCPASGVPAIYGCPCGAHDGFYCCGVGSGRVCGKDKIWGSFEDSPCHPDDQDAGKPIECG